MTVYYLLITLFEGLSVRICQTNMSDQDLVDICNLIIQAFLKMSGNVNWRNGDVT